jgi:hypothetical protein
MGGAVRAVTKPVAQVVQAVAKPVVDVVSAATGGKTSGQKQAEAQTQVAQAQTQAVQAQVAKMQEAVEKPKMRQATEGEERMGARMRGARRRGRSLLSDARLNAESGVQTLGSGQQL